MIALENQRKENGIKTEQGILHMEEEHSKL